MKLNCLIIDDEPVARKLLQEYIQDIEFLEWKGSLENALKALSFLQNQAIDLLFLDINMPKLTGIELLRASTHLPLVILTTAYPEYALESYDLDVLDYLIKPFSFERFVKACNKAREYWELKRNRDGPYLVEIDYFFVKCDNRFEKILYAELLAIEASLNYVTLHTTGRKLISYNTLKGIGDQLPAHTFLKVHKSFIVNLNNIQRLEGNEIHLGHLRIPVSQNLQSQVMQAILKDKVIKR
jgi:DNA-binding LytR/AlgR family response regulator